MTQNQYYMAQIGAKREQWQAELAETAKSHRAQEQLNMLQYNESLRHNLAMEREATRSALANEYLTQMRNAETARHDTESENISRYVAESDNMIGNRNATSSAKQASVAAARVGVDKFNADTNRRAQHVNADLGYASASRDERRVNYEETEATWRNRERFSNIVNKSVSTVTGAIKDITSAAGNIMGASGNIAKLFI